MCVCVCLFGWMGGWMHLWRTPLDGMTMLDSLPESYVIPGDKKLVELGGHIWIERKSG